MLKTAYFTFTRVLKRRAEITGLFADWISEEPTRTLKNPYAPLFKPMVVKSCGGERSRMLYPHSAHHFFALIKRIEYRSAAPPGLLF
jgi:hypothetical protein